MEENTIQGQSDDEISLIDLMAVLIRYKRLIIATTIISAAFILIFSVFSLILPPEKSPLPNKYSPKATMLIYESGNNGSSISGMLSSSGLGGLAGLAGFSGGGTSNSALAVYLTTSDSFLDVITDKFNLVEKWEIEKSPKANSRKMLKEKLKVNYDKDNGVFTITFTDIDPEFACDIVDFCVENLEAKFLELGLDKNILEKKNLEENIDITREKIVSLQNDIQELEYSVSNVYTSQNLEAISLQTNLLKLELDAQQSIYKQLKTQLELTKITLASEKPTFQVLERASVPDLKSAPSRGKLCIIVTFAGFFISIFLAFLLNAIGNIKNDETAMKKLKLSKKGK